MDNTKGKFVAIIQARIGSTRLPGKALLDIAGRPMLLHVIERMQRSEEIDKIVVATTHNERDDEIEDFCKKHEVSFYRGSENDVLDRYYQCAKEYAADIVVRVTSDCPLIDPRVVDMVINEYKKGESDYSSNIVERTYPRGMDVEVFSFKALAKAHREAHEDYQREHVTPFIHENPEKFILTNVLGDEDFSRYRITVDTPEDMEMVSRLYIKVFDDIGSSYGYMDLVNALAADSELLSINSGIEQKEIK